MVTYGRIRSSVTDAGVEMANPRLPVFSLAQDLCPPPLGHPRALGLLGRKFDALRSSLPAR